MSIHHRLIAFLTVACVALSGAGCAHQSNKDYDEVLMPLQTGSVLHRRVFVPAEHEKKTKKKKKPSTSKPEEEPGATPAPTPEEESTPSADRFR